MALAPVGRRVGGGAKIADFWRISAEFDPIAGGPGRPAVPGPGITAAGPRCAVPGPVCLGHGPRGGAGHVSLI